MRAHHSVLCRHTDMLKVTLFAIGLLLTWITETGSSISSASDVSRGRTGDVTRSLDRLTSRQRRHVKREILAVLGLDHVPRPTTRGARDLALAQYMLSLYQTVVNHTSSSATSGDYVTDNVQSAQLLDSADTVISFTNSYQLPPTSAATFSDATTWRVTFDMRSELLPVEAVTGAVLRLYKFPAYQTIGDLNSETRSASSPNGNNKPTTSTRLEVFRLKHQVQHDWHRSVELECTVNVDFHFHGWISLNVTRAVSDWSRHPLLNHGLALRVSSVDLLTGRTRVVDPTTAGFVTDSGPSDKQLFVVAFYKKLPASATTTSRSRRAATSSASESTSSARPERHRQQLGGRQDNMYSDEPSSPWLLYQSPEKHKRNCQRRSLYVSFRDLEWQEWIIAPEGYGAFYCDGDCSFPLHAQMNATNHAIVQTLAHLMNPTTVPKPCCAPTKLSATQVLYFDDNSNVILKKYRNMVVRACGCH